jgi:integrase/recombinase XerD
MSKKKIYLDEIKINGAYYILIKPEFDRQLQEVLSKLGCRYDFEAKTYSLLNTAQNYYRLLEALTNRYEVNEQALKRKYYERTINKRVIRDKFVLNEKANQSIEKFNKYLSSLRYSEQTRKSYLSSIKIFFGYFNDRDPIELGVEEVDEFSHNYILPKSYSASSQRQIISAIKLFYTFSKGSKMEIGKLVMPKKAKTLPKTLSMDDIEKMLETITNIKHRAIFLVLISTGIRMSELLNLKILDIDSKNEVIHIIGGKGKKSREVQLPHKLLIYLRKYYKTYKPYIYLFESKDHNKYSASSVNKIIKRASTRAGIKKSVSAHILRHSYATNLMENNVGLRYIQELLGHKSSKTTEIYTHVSGKKISGLYNPLDSFDIFVSENEINYQKGSDNPLF